MEQHIKEILRQLNSVSSLYAEVLKKVLMKLNLSVKRMTDFLVILVILQGSMTLSWLNLILTTKYSVLKRFNFPSKKKNSIFSSTSVVVTEYRIGEQRTFSNCIEDREITEIHFVILTNSCYVSPSTYIFI